MVVRLERRLLSYTVPRHCSHVMTMEEEADLDFIRSERCRLLISIGV